MKRTARGATLLLTLTLACTSSDDGPRSLVLIVIDTLRADRIGVGGYSLAVTPTLDSLATHGVRFSHAMTTAPVTCPAVASLLTGRLPFEHGVRDNEYFVLSKDEVTLAERFRSRKFRTAAVLGSAVLDASRGLDQGFDRYDDDFEGSYPVYDASLRPIADTFPTTRRRADEVTRRALAEIDRFGRDRFFLFVHYFDVHAHYDPPPEFGDRHPGRPYDGEVSFVDAEIGRLLDAVPPDALVLVVADHGESQNEHGEPQHGFLLYESTLHIPVIACGPGVTPGVVRDDPISLVDLEPSLAATFHLPDVPSPRSGRLLAWKEAPAAPADLYAETMRTLFSYGWAELRAIRRDDAKLIVGGGKTELYDLASDPNESDALVDKTLADSLLARLDDWTGDDDVDALLAEVDLTRDPTRRQVLRTLGYAANRSAADERPHPRDALPGWVRAQAAKETLRVAVREIEEGRLADAIRTADACLAELPRNAEAHYVRGYAQERSGNLSVAREDYERAVSLDPSHVAALAALAVLDERESREDDALEHWTAVLRLDPDHDLALLRAGKAWAARDSFDAALPLLEHLASQHPDNEAYAFDAGLVARETGRFDEAARHFGSFLRLAPNDPQAEETRRWLDEFAMSGGASR